MSNPQISLTDTDIQRIARLSGPDLARVYAVITERLQPHRHAQPNDNVLTVRVSLDAANHIKRLALRHGTTRSHVLQEAVREFVQRNPA